MTETKNTLAVIFATISDLGGGSFPRALRAEFDRLRRLDSRRVELQSRPKRAHGSDVLLAHTAPRRNGGLYLLVGALCNTRLEEPDSSNSGSSAKWSLRFGEAKDLRQFRRPIIVRHQYPETGPGFRRDDLLGERKNWGGSGFYYLPADAFERAIAEDQAQRVLAELMGEPPA